MTVSMRRVSLVGLIAIALASALLAAGTTSVRAATITVSTTADEYDVIPDGTCSLREAIASANTDAAFGGCVAGSGADVISLPAGTYQLTLAGTGENLGATGDLDITDDLTINGAGAGSTVLDGNDLDRVLHVRNPSALTVVLDGLTIRNGSAPDLPPPNMGGGGIAIDDFDVAHDVTIRNSVITANTSAVEGGGIDLFGGTLTLTDVAVTDNHTAQAGGGIFTLQETTSLLTRVTVAGNTAVGAGGGLFNLATMTVVDSTVAGNDAGADQAGGGVFTQSGPFTLNGSTVADNDAGVAAGIFSQLAALVINNSTISGNTASDEGAAALFHQEAAATLTHVTITNNLATGDDPVGAIFVQGSTFQFVNSIASASGAAGNFLFSPTSSTGSIDSDGTGGLSGPGDQSGTMASPLDPNLGPLADNGGPTHTHALLGGSPAIDAATNASCLPADQRGVGRPADGDGNGSLICDVGAYEVPGPTASINDVSVVEGDTGTVDAVFTVTLSRAGTGSLTVNYATANGTAVAPADYEAASGVVTFAAGDTSETVIVRVVGDTADEPNETFTVNLSGGTVGVADAQGVGTILDDDAGPVVTPTPAASQLPNTGTGFLAPVVAGPTALLALLVAVSSASVLVLRRRRV